jgi:hypothetical protein
MEEIVAAAVQLRNATEALEFKDIHEKPDEADPTRKAAASRRGKRRVCDAWG